MDRNEETPNDEKNEYVAPAIVDYGTLAEVTATSSANDLSDVPLGTTGHLGYSG
jgi:hypothetical protein